ncbi:MAG: preprotein translocase subunit YajC [Moritella sp.]|uniref:preprotein translocase subunit YajC n=1 Tax=Moritella sp. TaxID=78556 RepID=UPI001D3014D8|nr:preprotein translocase subunit YajC [Moritella sp.]NQZ51263.1 preprotein translocase subunit YajC [Moritella sp.]
MSLFIANAVAAEGVIGPAGGGYEMLIMLGIFGVIFYFMIYRPQAKRQKDQKNLMSSLSKGEEVLTVGGIVGKITKISDGNDYVVISIADATKVTIKRDYIAAVLPKGSMQSL